MEARRPLATAAVWLTGCISGLALAGAVLLFSLYATPRFGPNEDTLAWLLAVAIASGTLSWTLNSLSDTTLDERH